MEWITPEMVLAAVLAGVSLLMGIEYLRQRHRLSAMILGAGSGIAALLLLHEYGAALGFVPQLNLLTLGISALLGIPGVVLLLFVT